DEPHARLFGRPAALSVVAPPAGRDDILPGLFAALGNRHNVVEGEVLGSKLLVAILAGIAVAGEDVYARELDGSMTVLQPDQLEQTHHGRQLNRNRHSMNVAIIDLQDFDFALP